MKKQLVIFAIATISTLSSIAQHVSNVFAPIGAINIAGDIGTRISIIDIDFYADTTDEDGRGLGPMTATETVRFADNFIQDQNENYTWFNTMFYHHYGSEMVCVNQTKNYYRILVNDSGLCYWVRKSKLVEFTKIDEYIKSFYGVYRAISQPIYIKPVLNALVVPLPAESESQSFIVVQVKGDWLEIKSNEYADEATSFKSGWIKWRNGNKILIGFTDSM